MKFNCHRKIVNVDIQCIFLSLWLKQALLLSLIWFMIVTTDYMQTYVLIYAVCGFLSIVKALLAYFYLRYILFLVDDLSNVWFPWFTSLQKRIGNESADQMLSNDTMDEC